LLLAREPVRFYVVSMQRTLPVHAVSVALALSAIGCLMPLARAQDVPGDAVRQEYEERFRRLSTKIDEVLGIQATLQRRLNDLASDLASLREEQVRVSSQTVRPDDLRKLADKIREVDQKREEDRRLILEEIRKLAQAPIPEPAPRRETTRPKQPDTSEPTEAATPQKGYEYVVKEGDTISDIVAAYQQNGVKVTVDAVLKANPNIKPKSMPVGQKLFIPDPQLK